MINSLIENIELVIANVPLLKKELGMEYNENNVESMSSGNEEGDYVAARASKLQSAGASKNKSYFSRHSNKKRITKKSRKRGTKCRSHHKH